MTQLVKEATGTGELLIDGADAPQQPLPGWFTERRAEGWSQFQSLPMPVRTDETWRFSKLKALALDDFRKPQPIDERTAAGLVERSRPGEGCEGRMVFGNGRLIDYAAEERLAESGVVFTSFERAMDGYEEIIRRHFMVQGSHLGSEKFAALHQAFTESGTFLYLPRGVEVALPLEVFHWLDDDHGSTFPHTLIVAEPHSKVTLIDHFRSASDLRGFACAVNDLYIGEGAKVSYVCVQDWSEQVLAFQLNSTIAEKDSHVTGLNMNLGAGYSRVESRSKLNGGGARSDMLAVTIAENDQGFDLRTSQDHGARDTTSDLLYKNALSDSSKAVFSGIIRVEEGAHQTDAYQTNRSLVLSDDAESDSMPGLEILADDVKCSHGSTTGSVSDEELFYLMARGIPERVAQQLMVVGFLNEVLGRLPDETLADRLRTTIEERYQQIQRHQ